MTSIAAAAVAGSRLAAAPALFALRRLRARPFALALLTLSLAGAGALLGWSTLSAALAQERSVHLRLESLTPAARSLRVLYFTLPGEGDFRAPAVAAAIGEFGDMVGRTRRVRIWHSIEPGNPLGMRLVLTPRPRLDVVLSRGRLPTSCRATVCEAVALTGPGEPGDRVALGRGRSALIVGRGTLRPALTGGTGQLGRRALLLPSLPRTFRPLVAQHGSTVVTSAPLLPGRVHAFELPALAEHLRRTIVRLQRGDELVRPTAPLATLAELTRRGRVARERLLLVAGQAAALIVAFAAFAAGARRRDARLADEQLATLGASRPQTWTSRIVEALVPSAVATALALGGVWAAAAAVARARGLPGGFVADAVPLETVLAIAAVGAGAFLLLLAAAAPPRRPRLGVGALELAALTALALVVWQAWTNGALDPDELAARGGGPLLLLVPALACFAVAVLLLRLVPLALRLGERTTRRAPFGVRLAFLTAARNPFDAAAATTFLAVALGSALFSLGYRATLERQARDEARFAAGAEWRVSERGRGAQPDATPLTRYARATREPPTPVIRTEADVVTALPTDSRLIASVLALPAARVPRLAGWRGGFSSLSTATIARRLRPAPVRLAGPPLARDARAVRVWAHAQTDFPRLVVLHFLLPGQRFAHVPLGAADGRWRLLTARLGPSLRGAQLIGVEFVPTVIPVPFKYDPHGFVDLGPLKEHRAGGWERLPSIADWTSATSADGAAGILLAQRFEHAPVARGIRFDLNGTLQPLAHPDYGLPDALPGFETGALPALAGPAVAAQAVDGLLTVDLLGMRLPVRVVGRARLFPTILARPSAFLVLDYDTLFAALNAVRPGSAEPSEAWFFRPQPQRFAAAVAGPPFRSARAVGLRPLEQRLRADPLAAGTRAVLAVTAVVAALLGLLGLVLAVRATLVSERLLLAEYEALGVPPQSLRRSTQLRLVALSALGVVAGLAGALLGVRLVGAFVAVTGTAARPLPPIEPVVDTVQVALVVIGVAAAACAIAALLAGGALREPAARRLRA